jgi:hypothetical protein
LQSIRKAVLSIPGNVYEQQEKQLAAIKSIIDNKDTIDLCLQTFPKLLLLLAPKVTNSLYPECIANLKLLFDMVYRESRSGALQQSII